MLRFGLIRLFLIAMDSGWIYPGARIGPERQSWVLNCIAVSLGQPSGAGRDLMVARALVNLIKNG